jgi:hypothetical protein
MSSLKRKDIDTNHSRGIDHTAMMNQKSQLLQSKYEPLSGPWITGMFVVVMTGLLPRY